MHLTEDLRVVLREQNLENSTADQVFEFLRTTYGDRQQDEVTELLDRFTSLQQKAGETLRDYLTRCRVLFNKMKAKLDGQIDFIANANGVIATYYVRKGIKSDEYRALLNLDGATSWMEFEKKVTNLSQAEAAQIESGSANVGSQLPYKAPFQQQKRNASKDKYCKHHGQNFKNFTMGRVQSAQRTEGS